MSGVKSCKWFYTQYERAPGVRVSLVCGSNAGVLAEKLAAAEARAARAEAEAAASAAAARRVAGAEAELARWAAALSAAGLPAPAVPQRWCA